MKADTIFKVLDDENSLLDGVKYLVVRDIVKNDYVWVVKTSAAIKGKDVLEEKTFTVQDLIDFISFDKIRVATSADSAMALLAYKGL